MSDTATTSLRNQQPWPTGVTARIVTRMGVLLKAPSATVDLTDQDSHTCARTYKAHCRPCGWTAESYADRNKVLDKAQDHADGCTALPQPTA